MEKISFEYGNHISRVAKLLYFKSLKNWFVILFEMLLFFVCLTISIMDDSATLMFISIGVLLAMLFGLTAQTIIIPRRLINDPKFNHQIEVSYNADEIELRIEDAISKAKWNFFFRVWENEKYLLLFHNKKQYWIIPKESFNDSGHLNNFREHILKHKEIQTGIIR